MPEDLSSWRPYTVHALDATIIIMPLPRIYSDFEDFRVVAWYSTAYVLTITVI